MTDQDFGQWVSAHITETGAEPARLTELLWANKAIILDRWHATYEELCECSGRLIEGRRVPEFPNGHTNALGAELVALRTERGRRTQTSSNGATTGDCECERCHPPNGTERHRYMMAKLKAYLKRHGKDFGIGLEVPK